MALMHDNAPAPFCGFKAYGPTFNKRSGRFLVALVPNGEVSGLKRTTTSYSRYLVSVREGRLLGVDEHVDHLDEDRTNDTIENLRIVTRAENNRKHVAACGKTAVVVDLKCPNCGALFTRERRNTHLVKTGSSATFCSRKCSGGYSRRTLESKNSENVLRVYRK